MPGKMPEKKPFGRREPPHNFPTDPAQYADPQNYMYPLDKPIRAKLARRYFDEPRNRDKYTEQERLFIDSRIDEALKRFGMKTDEARAPSPPRTDRRKSPRRASRNDLDKLDLDELLQRFLGSARVERAKSIPDSLVSLSSLDRQAIAGNVKQYTVQIDLKNKVITHDCDDWKKNMRSKLMCKHLGKAFLRIENSRATAILRQILSELDDWSFNAP
ncbi:hypothetical protein [[Eubacterium] cellulosolvens]